MRFGFFDSEITGQTPEGMPIFDRAENAEFYAEYWGNLVGNGVYKDSTNFNPTPGTGMSVQLSAGRVYINGYYGSEDNQTICDIQAASSSLARIDTIVARLDYIARTITIEVLTGTPGSSPSAPALTQNNDRYEIPIADIRINSNTSSIASGNITDRREYVRALLPYEFEGVPTLGHSKSGTVHRLTGLPSSSSGLVSAVFTATAAYTVGDTITVDGTSYTIQLSNGEAAEDNLFVSGASVAVIVDTEGKKVNFKSGGGVSSAKLALADAEEGDVASGKTFYAGDKSLKTGTFVGYQYITGTVDVPVRISSECAYLYPPFSPKIFIGKVLSGGHDGGGIVNMQAPFSFKLSYQRGDWQSGEDAYSVVFYSDGSIGVSVVYDGSAEEANMQYIILG